MFIAQQSPSVHPVMAVASQSGKRAASLALVREMSVICGRIGELIALFAEADRVLAATLEETLSRAALGIAQAE
jgi:hypothetical protein